MSSRGLHLRQSRPDEYIIMYEVTRIDWGDVVSLRSRCCRNTGWGRCCMSGGPQWGWRPQGGGGSMRRRQKRGRHTCWASVEGEGVEAEAGMVLDLMNHRRPVQGFYTSLEGALKTIIVEKPSFSHHRSGNSHSLDVTGVEFVALGARATQVSGELSSRRPMNTANLPRRTSAQADAPPE